MIYEFATVQCYRNTRHYAVLINYTPNDTPLEELDTTSGLPDLLAELSARGWRVCYVIHKEEQADND